MVVGDLRVDIRTREAWLSEAPLDLSRKEFDLLALLASRPGEVVSKRALQAEIWHQADVRSLQQQLGVVPAPGASAGTYHRLVRRFTDRSWADSGPS